MNNLILNTIISKYYTNIYELDLKAMSITEYSIPSLEPLETISFEQWSHQIVSHLQFIQIKPFKEQTKLSLILQRLEGEPFHLINYQTMQEDSPLHYQLVFCYSDDKKEKLLITRQNITAHMKESYEHTLELEKDSVRFRFLISHLCENFGEIHVATGNTWMTTCNDWEVSQGNLKSQIEWFAENLIVPEQKEAYRKDFELNNLVESLRKNNGFYTPTYEANYPDGRRHLLIINALLSNVENPADEYIFGCVQDITQLKTQEAKNKHLLDISQELLTLSQIDPLTKLYNRIAGEKQVCDYLQEKSKRSFAALLVIDIDYFKKFNDQYGHPVGDSVLKHLAASMQSVFRASDVLCRWGGDEFVIFMPDVSSMNTVEGHIEALQKKMNSHRRNHWLLPITLSIGGVLFKEADSLNSLYEEADQNLYQVKDFGKNNYHITVKA